MAALARPFRSSSSSAVSFIRRSLSTEAAVELRSQSYSPRVDPKTRNVQWVFLGCPGVGKGTYASRLSALLGVPHIATGDLVREELSSSGPLSKQVALRDCKPGSSSSCKWVDLDEDQSGKASPRTSTAVALKYAQQLPLIGWSWSGFTKPVHTGCEDHVTSEEILDEVTDIDLVVNLKLPENVLLEKCLGRRLCSQCGKNFNVALINVKGENGNPDISMAPLLPPSECVSKLITRSDDTEPIVKERLRIYNEKSQPVEGYYRNHGKLLEFDLPGGIPESWPKLLEALNLDENEDKHLWQLRISQKQDSFDLTPGCQNAKAGIRPILGLSSAAYNAERNLVSHSRAAFDDLQNTRPIPSDRSNNLTPSRSGAIPRSRERETVITTFPCL
ncbi:adenylate kinase [Sesamum angolense]|uniref:adenylate kinase n=1 Tax=Sesamum angolense TaxID=2727404 RepID=A0AAE2BSN2_9LAMI|nr:adenylate kinase [Sesamum angolense]